MYCCPNCFNDYYLKAHIDKVGKSKDFTQNKIGFQSRYKFSIAFKNFECPGYSTEKILDAFAARTIPIYWGNKRIVEDFNSEAFINAYDFG